MAEAQILNGVAMAAEVKGHVAERAAAFAAVSGRPPGLAVVLAGENPASKVYVRSKLKLARELGFHSVDHRPPADISKAGLLDLIASLNADEAIDGVLVQLPLPAHLNADDAIAAIAPEKDVDGFHVVNAGRLFIGKPAFVPCTPLGCIILSKSVHASLEGMNAIVIGRSNLVGRPLLQLLLNENATVTIAHSRSRDLAKLCAQADLVYAAVGKPEMVRADWIKPGATVIDVGINRLPTAEGKTKLVGDVALAEVSQVAGAITPVPGGVGQMTVACLLVNTLRAASAIAGLPKPAV